MRNPSVYSALALAGLLFAGSAQAEEPARKEVIHKKIVMIDKDGKEHVVESEGTPVRRGYLGVGLVDLTPELRTHFGVPAEAGVMVSTVEDGSPADKAGIKVGDILGDVDGKDVKSSWDIRGHIRDLKEGEQVPVQLWRNGKVQNAMVTIALRERPEMDMGPLLLRGDGDHGPMVIEIDREKLRRAGPSWTPEPGGPAGMRSAREIELEKRLKDLEKRLAELEKLLEKK